MPLTAAPVFVPSDINTTVRGGILIKISESSYTIGDDGRLVIPADDLTEMGLTAGQDVFVAYIADDGLANRYHEFTVSSVSLSELDTTQQIAIPQQLLEQAGIDSNAEVQITCMDGAIIITGDTPLTSLNIIPVNWILKKEEEQAMAASKNMIALEINGLHVHLTFAPFPADDTVATVRSILKNSYVRTLQA